VKASGGKPTPRIWTLAEWNRAHPLPSTEARIAPEAPSVPQDRVQPPPKQKVPRSGSRSKLGHPGEG
jgi:hypothetical protein